MAKAIIKSLAREEFKLIDTIIQEVGDIAVSASWIRSALKLMTKNELLDRKGGKLQEQYQIRADVDDETIKAFIADTYGEDIEELPAKFREYHRDYGFDDLVGRVSKWIDHNGTTHREYSTDRLWLGRFVDFLDKAKEYLKWFDADQALAKRKLKKIRQQNGKS